ncbi:McrB family protein [Leptolyngbya ohadii]|uniref:McrB family protein n=1 Tax=Leptolyngbya ohadii TaxID=1962290 RepID=UPI001CEC04B1|nr:AAA family ATPase [Leptolyngbya ohadii]
MLAAKAHGEDITDLVLLKLLPYAGSASNRAKGAWVHHAPSITSDLRKWYEADGSAYDWKSIGNSIFDFIQRCNNQPTELEQACKYFSELPHTKGFQAGFLTPILNALRSEEFLLINSKSQKTISYFTDQRYSSKLSCYPETNRAGHGLIQILTSEIDLSQKSTLSNADQFDMFCHWLVAVKKFSFSKSRGAQKSAEFFDEIPEEVVINSDCPFTSKTFDLLAELSANPKKTTYLARKDEFKRELEEPFQKLFRQIANQLPDSIKERMETERKLFARIPKNDFNHGGAWDFYWGAFYAKGGKRIEDAQLFLWINNERLEFGFYIGQYGSQQRQRFLKNCQDNREVLYSLLDESLSNSKIWYGSRANPTYFTWEEWLKSPGQLDIHVAISLPQKEVLETSTDELTPQILETYKLLFPLVLLALDDNPMPALAEYLEPDEPIVDIPPINPIYTLAQCADDTHFSAEQLDTWLRAIERKKQAVLYGPPGTGKTFVAQKLAKHLISEGDGFFDVVQFHPAYTYEDFIQGIRPKRVDGGLDYSIVPGRFLEFCKKARQCRDRCVLIIDEINRANLAQVFGELMYLMEYRDAKIHLASGEAFSIPANVRIIGTMNTADRSIALVDHALRRRFAFLYLPPNYEGLRKFHASTGYSVDKLVSQLAQINAQIGDRHYEIGTSFFLRQDIEVQLQSIWQLEIEPYLEEFFFDQPDKVKRFQWEAVKSQLIS